jgi:hypothetical protein
MVKLRVKLGMNPYEQEFTCSHCREQWDNTETRSKTIWLRLEVDGKLLDFPICPKCTAISRDNRYLYETMSVDATKTNHSHPIGLA